jgi:hypothetical protein
MIVDPGFVLVSSNYGIGDCYSYSFTVNAFTVNVRSYICQI